MEKRNRQPEQGQPMEQQEFRFARATPVWLAVNYRTEHNFIENYASQATHR